MTATDTQDITQMNKTHILEVIASVVLLAACSKAPPATPPTQPEVVQGPVPTTDEALAAIARYAPHSHKVCYDSEWGYFLDYGPTPAKVDDDLHGIWLIQNVVFHKSVNNTFFIDNIDQNSWIAVQPDLNNLPCKLVS